ncbi:MAG: aminopeptidase P family protein [Lachnospiraceae bacterium]|nr:aminopeptidase P family protein [Lachnospiraceae bacterium]
MISKAFHASRRKLYQEKMKKHTIECFYSGDEKQQNGDQNYAFVPDADFYYLTGFDKPGALLLTIKKKRTVLTELFIERTDERKARWEGVSYTTESVSELTGIQHVHYMEELDAFVKNIKKKYPDMKWKKKPTDISRIRQVKTKEEIALHRRACQITTEGVDAILKNLKPGLYEYEIEAEFDYVLGKNHAKHAFDTIAASGPKACVLHYHDNDRKMQPGDMVLFDLGAEWGHYASDVSRTYPVDGVFTKEQRELYEVVLSGLEAAEALAKPGQPKAQLQEVSKKIMAEGLIKLGKIKKAKEIDKYYYHGSGHFIGLFTHDVGDNEAILEPDMMFTLEPGLYFEEEGIGIRIEDTLLVTKTGCEILSAGIPKTVEDIEAAMKKG